MKLSHLRAFVAVTELGGFRRAGRHLGIAQSALSRSMRDLEIELGVRLFERGSTGLTPTPAGVAFARRAAAVQIQLDRARDELYQLRGECVGEVAVGLSTTAHIALLSQVLPSSFTATQISFCKSAKEAIPHSMQPFAMGPVTFTLVR